MANVTKNRYSEESHPWNWEISDNANTLVVGTFPTTVNKRVHDFFYCSSTNRFWEVFCTIAGFSIDILKYEEAIATRKKILQKLSLGLTDMGKIVLRQQGSANDHSLFPLEFMDIIKIVEDQPGINRLIFSGSSEGNSSLSWFGTYCSLNGIKFDAKKLERDKTTDLTIGKKSFKLYIGYSTSRRSRVDTASLVDSYRSIINP